MLPPAHRLRAGRDIRRVYARGRSYPHPTLVLYVLRTEGQQLRVGFSVSKKRGGAVRRNTIKRRLREVARRLLPQLAPGFDAVVVARSQATDAPVSALQSALADAFGRAGVMVARQREEAPTCGDGQAP